MKADAVNRWLTLGANFGVLVGIILLIAELNQNSVLMRGQIFNERAGQGIDLFMSVAESPELSDIIGVEFGSDTPELAAARARKRAAAAKLGLVRPRCRVDHPTAPPARCRKHIHRRSGHQMVRW